MRAVLLGSGSYKSSLTYYRLVTLGKELSRLGWDISIIVPSADKYNDFTPDKQAHIEGVALVQPWQPATRSMPVNLLPYLFTATWAMLRRRAQLIYLYKPTPITIIGLLPKLLFGTPMVLDLDDLGSEVMRLEGQPAVQVKLVAWCERVALRHATAVVVASTYLRDMVRAKYPGKPVLVLSNGVDLEEYPAAPEAAPRPVLYYFGALNRLSLIEPLLRALPQTFAAVPDATAYILGGGKALDEARQLAQHLGIAGRVTFTGWVDKDAIRAYARFADIALCTQPDMPTVRAASNMKVFQYMSVASVPVVSDVGDLGSYVAGDGQEPAGAVVPADDEQALASVLIHLLTHPDERAKMALAARKRAETTYALPVLARRLQAFITAHATQKKRR